MIFLKIEQAIKLAIEGGYSREFPFLLYEVEKLSTPFEEKCFLHQKELFLDPSFWRCLGKSLGWGDDKHQREIVDEHFCLKCSKENWRGYWHRFIDHLASGKTVEDFFTSLPEIR